VKILHIIPALGKGGAERLVLNIVGELSKRENVTVKLITFRDTNAYPFLTEGIDWEVTPARLVPSITGKSIVEVEEIGKAIENFQPDIIHTHLFEAEIISKEVIQRNVTYFTHFHDNMPPFQNLRLATFFNKEKLLRYFERLWMLKKYRHCNNYFIGISKDGESYLKENLPKNLRHKIMLLPNAIETSRFSHAKSYDKAANEPWKLVTIGSLLKNKGHYFLLLVIKHLLELGYSIEFKIIGGGTEKRFIEQKIEELALSKNVELVGFAQHPEAFLFNADIYIHGAEKEAFGLVLLEAMATGLPVVTTNGKGNRDLIEEGKNGFLLEERSVEKFAKKVIELIENAELRRNMGAYAASFSKKYSIEKYADNLLSIYAETSVPS